MVLKSKIESQFKSFSILFSKSVSSVEWRTESIVSRRYPPFEAKFIEIRVEMFETNPASQSFLFSTLYELRAQCHPHLF
jgi:hypothetical protein